MTKLLSAAVIGSDIDALQTALFLAQCGTKVSFITDLPAFSFSNSKCDDRRVFWSTVLNATKHQSVDFVYNSKSLEVSGRRGSYQLRAAQRVSYVDPDRCTACKRCEETCSTRLPEASDVNATRTAIHRPYGAHKSVPSAVLIDKKEIAPCRGLCPLGINVQGFVSLLANGKTQEAYDLIQRSAPLGGILGRLCKHPCEADCSRTSVDSSVSIRALHRYAYDHGDGTTQGTDKAASPTGEKVAIVGSGPAGLMAAWELKLRGYEPTVFEAHSTFGGMLATGIPRFRLSREIREREINRLTKMGIKIRTGIAVGRDVDFAYLKERNYKAFFLAIGASKNNRLNIPGEELSGVIDCMSFLITLNQMDDTFVGSNIVVIGDGNTAVDSARVAVRKTQGTVRIVSWTVPEELTASRDEIEEAFEEGVGIEYSAYPLEILGDGNAVVGVRCQRTSLTDQLMRNGWHMPEPVPGTDFVISADHVIVAIGQSADATQLNMEGLEIDRAQGTIKVNPLTLETSVRGVFAGGDCMRGPNNVVDAMADGRRAAESIDRYLCKRDLELGRQTKPATTVDIDLATVRPAQIQRAQMPYLSLESRKDSYEETTLGLSAEAAQKEAKRCLSCALCSECMECLKVCGAQAITHDSEERVREISADIVLDFSALTGLSDSAQEDGIYRFEERAGSAQAAWTDLNTALLTLIDAQQGFEQDMDVDAQAAAEQSKGAQDSGTSPLDQSAVVLCRCNGNNSTAIDFERMTGLLQSRLPITHVVEVEQACTENGAAFIREYLKEWGLNRAVLAACRCCSYDDVCYSCNERRILCKRYIENCPPGPNDLAVDYVNIRELCAWPHRNDRAGATDKAASVVEAAVRGLGSQETKAGRARPIRPVTLFMGRSAESESAGAALSAIGYRVLYHDSVPAEPQASAEDEMFSFEIEGNPGDYMVKVTRGQVTSTLHAGAIVVDARFFRECGLPGDSYVNKLFGRLFSHIQADDAAFNRRKYESCMARGGLFITRGSAGYDQAQTAGISLAARILRYLRSNWVDVGKDAAQVDAALCRGCHNCSDRCLLVEIRDAGSSLPSAYIEPSLCNSCGACSSSCPTGAITIGKRSGKALRSSLRPLLCEAGTAGRDER